MGYTCYGSKSFCKLTDAVLVEYNSVSLTPFRMKTDSRSKKYPSAQVSSSVTGRPTYATASRTSKAFCQNCRSQHRLLPYSLQLALYAPLDRQPHMNAMLTIFTNKYYSHSRTTHLLITIFTRRVSGSL